jgi:hypothetical protein
MRAAGCGPTAVADIFYNFDKSITPKKVADWFAAHGFDSYKQGTVWTGIPAYFNKHGAKGTQLNADSLYGNRNSQAEKNWVGKMKTGKYWGILLMGKSMWTKGGHYIAITEYRDGKYYVMDPAGRNDGWHSWPDFDGYVKIFYLIDLPAAKKAATTTKKDRATTSATSYYPKYTGKSISIDEVFKTVGVPEKYRSTWKNRLHVAKANGIAGYTGSEAQNRKLISLAKSGKLKKCK